MAKISKRKTIFLPDDAKGVYSNSLWGTFTEWTKSKTPTQGNPKTISLLFTTKHLHKDTKGNQTYFLIVISAYNNVLFIRDFYMLDNTNSQDKISLQEAKRYALSNPYVREYKGTATYYATDIANHKQLLGVIKDIAEGEGNNFLLIPPKF